ncbi:hypothetical protein BJ165DRAFT_1598944 [Panaeolus papilionaceus]|nr:hypothetical protein BJ165DRAFT_1598944 [Panaeolus papilionaceus]
MYQERRNQWVDCSPDFRLQGKRNHSSFARAKGLIRGLNRYPNWLSGSAAATLVPPGRITPTLVDLPTLIPYSLRESCDPPTALAPLPEGGGRKYHQWTGLEPSRSRERGQPLRVKLSFKHKTKPDTRLSQSSLSLFYAKVNHITIQASFQPGFAVKKDSESVGSIDEDSEGNIPDDLVQKLCTYGKSVLWLMGVWKLDSNYATRLCSSQPSFSCPEIGGSDTDTEYESCNERVAFYFEDENMNEGSSSAQKYTNPHISTTQAARSYSIKNMRLFTLLATMTLSSSQPSPIEDNHNNPFEPSKLHKEYTRLADKLEGVIEQLKVSLSGTPNHRFYYDLNKRFNVYLSCGRIIVQFRVMAAST